MRIGAVVAYHDYGDLVAQLEPDCPPAPLFLPNVNKTVLAFVQRDGGASRAQLRRLAARAAPANEEETREGPPTLVVVVDGADPHQADALRRELGLEAMAIPDPKGRITDRFGVDTWPTTITVDRRGVVTDVEVGQAAVRAAPPVYRHDEELPPDRTAV